MITDYQHTITNLRRAVEGLAQLRRSALLAVACVVEPCGEEGHLTVDADTVAAITGNEHVHIQDEPER